MTGTWSSFMKMDPKRLARKTAAAALSALIALVSWPALPVLAADAQDQDNPSVESVEVLADSVMVHTSGDVKYKTVVTANPPRLILQLDGAEYHAAAKKFAGKGKLLKAVRAGQYSRDPELVARVVLDLNASTDYKVTKTDDGLRVDLGAAPAKTEQAKAPAATPAPPVAIKPKAQTPAVVAQAKPVEKRPAAPAPAAKPAPVATHDAPSDKPAAKPKEVGNMSTELSPELAQDAAKTSVEGESQPDAGKAVDLAPAAPVRPRFEHGGDIMTHLPTDLVSLDFDGTDIRDVLRLMSAKAHINLIYGNDVSGNLTLHLVDVQFADAFRTALSMMNLITVQVGDNILRVMSPTGLKTQAQVGLTTEVIPLNYQQATAVLAAVNQVRTAEGRTGTAVADSKTNSIIITETVEGLLSAKRLIADLDQRPKQVLIEAKLIEVNLSDSLNYGVQWDYASIDTGRALGKRGDTFVGAVPGIQSNPFNSTLNGSGLDQNTIQANGLGATGVTGASGRGTGVNLPSDKVFGAFTLGRVVNNYMLSATLTAAAANGKVKVLSDPKVATLNNQAATINVQTQFPYVTSNVTATGVTSNNVQYVATGITLSVTPSINADGRITLAVQPTVSQPSATAAAAAGGAPGIDTRNANTTVLVRDGETIVIGGLISDSISDTISKIPLLGDIPILGWLFKKRSKQRVRSELLIFVTPKIID